MSLIGQLPAGLGGGFASEARDLQSMSAAQEERNRATANQTGQGINVIPGTNFDAVETARKIYPILYATRCPGLPCSSLVRPR